MKAVDRMNGINAPNVNISEHLYKCRCGILSEFIPDRCICGNHFFTPIRKKDLRKDGYY